MFNEFVQFVRELYQTKDFIPLHAPQFHGNEKKYLLDTIDSTYVSSVGEYVDYFEESLSRFTSAKYAIATVNGTSALHIALKLVGVESGTEVITQSLTFVATCNAIRYCQAEPVFVDVDTDTLGLSPDSLKAFLDAFADIRDDGMCWNRKTNRKIAACLPMHTFGMPAKLTEIKQICDAYNLPLVEDAAESLGSYYKKSHTGLIGKTAAISFNGNKIVTTGGGGVILTNDAEIARRAKHLTTTAKVPHRWEFVHDEIGYNYRLPNLNAALGVAQMESLPSILISKRRVAQAYQRWCENTDVIFITEPQNTRSNYWLNVLLTESRKQRDEWLKKTNDKGVMTRPAWVPMHRLEMNKHCQTFSVDNTDEMYDRILNIPSGPLLQ